MRFTPLGLDGAYLVEIEKHSDDRGFFARTFSSQEFSEQGLCDRFVQANISFTRHAGTVRGMHLQQPPHQEAKLIRCTRGAIYDVGVDLRRDSSTFLRHAGMELRAGDEQMIYLPEGIAHGLMTLDDETEVSYLMSHAYAPEASTGVRWDDPSFDITWPRPVRIIAERDRSWPDFAG